MRVTENSLLSIFFFFIGLNVCSGNLSRAETQLTYLFEKPYEKLSRPRGPNGDVVYTPGGSDPLGTRAGFLPPTTVLSVPGRPVISAAILNEVKVVPRGKPFSTFLRTHRTAARLLANAFGNSRTAEDLMQVAASVQDEVNEELFIYALAITVLKKRELENVQLPTIVEVFPAKFVPQEDIAEAQATANRMPPGDTSPVIIVHDPEFSGTLQKPEHRVGYWREDYGVNSHHWHWHLVYPLQMGIERDRKGELFYYMHEQMLARYDMERMSVGLPRVEKLDNWRIPIPDGYFSKLNIGNSGRHWGTRQDNTLLKDVQRGNARFQISELETWRARLFEAIQQGFLIDRQGGRVPLTDDVPEGQKRGIDLLGDAIEADEELSVNYPLYGEIHNIGHVVIAFSHDSTSVHKEEVAVMGDTATAMRDPVFYRWHKFVDSIFQEYKERLTPYTERDLVVEGIQVTGVGVRRENEHNVLHTGWSVRDFEASRGLDFNAAVPVFVRLTHLTHKPFNYHILVVNSQGPRQVTVRLFLAPKLNARGQQMSFAEQRTLWTEMDKFTIALNNGQNHIVRASSDSSITNKDDATFRNLEKGRNIEPGSPESFEFNFSGCGWPHHLLLPRGDEDGMTYQLFVMITDFALDRVIQNVDVTGRRAHGVSFCGILDAKFPDRRPMGFPFDRNAARTLFGQDVYSVNDFARLPNMAVSDVNIFFLNQNLTNTYGN